MEEKIRRIYVPMTESGFYILFCLRTPQHGYGISQQVKEMTGGEVTISAGTMYGTLSKMEKDGLIVFVAEEDKRRLYQITALGREILTQTLEEEDWANSWKRYYEPIPVGKRLLIVPEWLEAGETGRTVLRLDPGIAFGTGSHATTRMCLQALEGTGTTESRQATESTGWPSVQSWCRRCARMPWVP